MTSLSTQTMSDGSLRYRFVCTCGVQGAWHEVKEDAERSGERHERIRHAEVKA